MEGRLQASQDANDKPVLMLKGQKELKKLRAQDQGEIKCLKQELRRKEKALVEAAACSWLHKRTTSSGERTVTTNVARRSPEGSANLG